MAVDLGLLASGKSDSEVEQRLLKQFAAAVDYTNRSIASDPESDRLSISMRGSPHSSATCLTITKK